MGIQEWRMVMGWTIVPLCIAIAVATPAWAQSVIVPDETLGGERSRVEFRATSERITGGAARGINLFHSFREFNVGDGRSTYFIAPNAGIENILARVTGQNPSEILGRLGTAQLVNGGLGISNANLFLINPNGIVFGQNASLDVDRSFVATTSNGVGFGDLGTFNTTQPEVPSTLLTINPSVFLFNQISPGNILVQANRRITPGGDALGLQVPDGESILLVGGNVTIDGGQLDALGGRVEIVGLAGQGTVKLNPNSNSPWLSSSNNVTRANALILNGASIDVTAGDRGSIVISARNLEIKGESTLDAGILLDSGELKSRAGHITLDVSGNLIIAKSYISNVVQENSFGNGGNINITAGKLIITDGAKIRTGTFSNGFGGDINVRAFEIELTGYGQPLTPQNLTALQTLSIGSGNAGSITIISEKLTVQKGSDIGSGSLGSGNGGDLTVTTKQLTLRDVGQMTTTTRGRGNAGKLLITASELIELGGSGPDGRPTSLGSETLTNGNAGDVSITTEKLIIQDGTFISSSTFGRGKGGNLIIRASESVEVSGESPPGAVLPPSSLQPTSSQASAANSAIFTETRSSGQAGHLTIITKQLTLRDGAQVSTASRPLRLFGNGGQAGDITIIASEGVKLVGTTRNSQGHSGLLSSTQGTGNAGNIKVNTQNLVILDGARVVATTDGEGNAGNIDINASNSVLVSGIDPVDRSPSTIQTSTFKTGRAGDIKVATNIFQLFNSAILSASTSGNQDSGDITIQTGQFEAANGGQLQVLSRGDGKAGDIDVTVSDIFRATDSGVFALAFRSSGGSVKIRAKDIRLSGDSDIFTSVFSGQGNGGNITLIAKSIIALNDSNILAFSRDGRGGNITLNTRAFFGQNYRSAPQGTNPFTLIGNNRVDINASGTVSGIITLPDVSFLQNGLNQLPSTQIDTNALLANSCIVRRQNRNRSNNSFYITGSSSLPLRPGDPPAVPYPTGELQAVVVSGQLSGASSVRRLSGKRWQKGDPIAEPTGVYQLPDGQLILSRECSQ